MHTERMGLFSRHHLFFLGLGVLFVVSFLTPIIVGTHLSGVREAPVEVATDPTFPESKSITARSGGFALPHDPRLEPAEGADFLVTGWFKPRVLPKDGQRMILFSKFSTREHLGAGYAIALEGENGTLRPAVYWRDATQGRWLRFAELPEPPRGWFMIALSLNAGRYLGVHGAFLSPEGARPTVALLGGYDVSAISAPRNSSTLTLGSGGSRRFVGRVGPFGVFSLPDFKGDFDRLVKDMARRPREADRLVDRDEVQFWSIDLERDRSGNALAITRLETSSGGGDDPA